PFFSQPFAHVLTCDFGSSSISQNSFLLGVVYDDADSDGLYTVGEGIKNVEITVLEAGESVLTGNAGGYTIQLAPRNYTVQAVLPDGRSVTRLFEITDQNVKIDFLLSEFTDYTAPKVTIDAQPRTIFTNETTTLIWSSSHADSCVIEPAIGSVGLNDSLLISPDTTTEYTITATGPGGSSTSSVVVKVADPADIPTVNISAEPPSIVPGGSAVLTWTSTDSTAVFIDNGVCNVISNGSVSVSPENTTYYMITVIGPGGSASAAVTVEVSGSPTLPSEGSFGEIYENLIPLNASIEAYDEKRFSVVTGLVQTDLGDPLPDVMVTIHDAPEYGAVMTDTDGNFSLPAEGGATLTVNYQKQGMLPSHRKIYVPWNDIAIVETIQMIEMDKAFTVVAFDGNPDTVINHRSTPVTDEFGTRACTMTFTGDNHAYAVDEEGNIIQELSTIITRATEFATIESMPAVLPPHSAYTYCAELSVDGVQRVIFDKPVVTWVDNFLGFEVGSVVPAGYYNRDKGVWVSAANGIVVRLLDEDEDGIVDALDSDGDFIADDLNENGSFSDEIAGLEDSHRYTPWSTYWRVEVTHFTPWDYNWPYRPDVSGAVQPNPDGEPVADEQKSDDCKQPINSYVEERSRIFHEDIAIPGTGVGLHYSSNRVDGYQTKITVPMSGETVPASLEKILVHVTVAGRHFKGEYEPAPNLVDEFTWDGLDFLGNEVKGSIAVQVDIGFQYRAVYLKADEFDRAFANTGSDITSVPSRQSIVSWKRNSIAVSRGVDTIAEGWTVTPQHYLGIQDRTTLHKGNGLKITSNAEIIETVAGTGIFDYNGDGLPLTRLSRFKKNKPIFNELRPQTLLTSFKF
ncbi:MAG: hypothetical protein KAR13_14745, partial [Desulfobulbaceae bacterium]|nr:hypothetical protein [Desulfobulbaceae bacterium]